MRRTMGCALPANLRREALSRFVHRFTKEHVPNWAKKPMPNGKLPPVQFATDEEWLNSTVFFMNNACTAFDERYNSCESGKPTWPDNPELRS